MRGLILDDAQSYENLRSQMVTLFLQSKIYEKIEKSQNEISPIIEYVDIYI